MKEFKGTKGPWVIESTWCANGHIISNLTGDTGETVIVDTKPLKYGNPTIFSITSREVFPHKGNFTDTENTTGFYNCSDIPHKANTQLISTAPELLEALQSTLALINSTFKNEGWDCEEYTEVIKGREAVKKALGL